ncbi:MAG: hypothetical protein RI897_1983 [Verrucomicrobiota bacterium]
MQGGHALWEDGLLIAQWGDVWQPRMDADRRGPGCLLFGTANGREWTRMDACFFGAANGREWTRMDACFFGAANGRERTRMEADR